MHIGATIKYLKYTFLILIISSFIFKIYLHEERDELGRIRVNFKEFNQVIFQTAADVADVDLIGINQPECFLKGGFCSIA